jgi:serine/threonine protein kinase
MTEEKRSAATMVGEVLDARYRIESLLGEGGMGAVYSATDMRLDKLVAVKVMARELASNPDALARFHREARITSALGHPHIVQVIDFSTAPTGEPFLVMEFLEGEDLDHRLRRMERLPLDMVVHIVKQVASALAATHAKAIVHRDLKPGNIYLLEIAGEPNFVKVLDFGISKVRTSSTKLTRSDSVMGTPNYMSPEQARGRVEDIDDRTDQWALACITWECLSGTGPFVGENFPSILFQIVHEPPPPLLPQVPGLQPAVESVLLRALAKDKNERFANVGEAASLGAPSVVRPNVERTALLPVQTIVDSVPTKPPFPPTTFTQAAGELDDDLPVTRSSSRKWAWGLAAGAVVAWLIVGFLLLRPTPVSQPVTVSPPPREPSPFAEPPAFVPPPAEPVPLAAPAAEVKHEEAAAPAKKTAAPASEPSVAELPSKSKKTRPAVTAPVNKRPPSKEPQEEDQELWH